MYIRKNAYLCGMENILEQIRIFFFGKERTLIKTIINWGFVLLVIAGFTEYGIDHNGDMSGLLKKETWETNNVNPQTDIKKKIYLRTLGVVPVDYVERTKKIISERFNVDVEVIENAQTKNEFFIKDGYVSSSVLLKKLPKKGKTITIVGYKILDENGKKLGGVTLGLNILVSSKCRFFDKALVHEFGHSLFLKHCDNQNCVMSTNPNTGLDFCDNCKSKSI